MTIIDTHTHIYKNEYLGDLDAMMQRADNEGVKEFYMPGIDAATIEPMLALEAKYPGRCHAMMGVHPCSVAENFQQEVDVVAGWLGKRPFAAVGEIGLDFYWDKTFTKQQFEAFHQQIELALQHQLPIVIHTRNAMDETLAVVKQYTGRGLRGIFHCFGGPYEAGIDIINMGFYLGIGGVLTYKKSGLDGVLAKIGLEHLVLETDAPYLTPVPFRGKRNEPSYLKYVVERLAEVKGVPVEEVARVTTENAEKVFGKSA